MTILLVLACVFVYYRIGSALIWRLHAYEFKAKNKSPLYDNGYSEVDMFDFYGAVALWPVIAPFWATSLFLNLRSEKGSIQHRMNQKHKRLVGK